MTDMSPVTFAVLTVEAVDGKKAAVKLIVELLEELARVYQMREIQNAKIEMRGEQKDDS